MRSECKRESIRTAVQVVFDEGCVAVQLSMAAEALHALHLRRTSVRTCACVSDARWTVERVAVRVGPTLSCSPSLPLSTALCQPVSDAITPLLARACQYGPACAVYEAQ